MWSGNATWPNPEFVVRALNNGFVAKWHGREQEMEKVIDLELARFSRFANGIPHVRALCP
jgi:hypothetical protein